MWYNQQGGDYMDKTICELFAGVGGFRLGFERNSKNWKTVWFSQWEPGKKNQWAHDCYVSHFGDINEFTGIDIAEVNKKSIPNHSLLVGGFPCQDYSVARPLSGSSGIEGKKGVLWWQIRDILVEKKPPFVLLENVDRLIKSPANQRGRDFGIMLACFNALDYRVEWRVVNAAEYGSAQKRRRVFIFAYHKSTEYAKTHDKINPLDTINEYGFFAKTFPIEKIKNTFNGNFENNDIYEISKSFKFEFYNSGYMKDGIFSTSKTISIKESPTNLKDILEHNVDTQYYLGENVEDWERLKGSKKINRISKSGHQYTFSEGAIPFPDKLDSPARTILTSETGKSRSTHIIEDPETQKYRFLTPVETERIQGFDDNWTNTGMPHKFRYFCMGNALVVPMITRMAKTLNKIIEAEK